MVTKSNSFGINIIEKKDDTTKSIMAKCAKLGKFLNNIHNKLEVYGDTPIILVEDQLDVNYKGKAVQYSIASVFWDHIVFAINGSYKNSLSLYMIPESRRSFYNTKSNANKRHVKKLYELMCEKNKYICYNKKQYKTCSFDMADSFVQCIAWVYKNRDKIY